MGYLSLSMVGGWPKYTDRGKNSKNGWLALFPCAILFLSLGPCPLNACCGGCCCSCCYGSYQPQAPIIIPVNTNNAAADRASPYYQLASNGQSLNQYAQYSPNSYNSMSRMLRGQQRRIGGNSYYFVDQEQKQPQEATTTTTAQPNIQLSAADFQNLLQAFAAQQLVAIQPTTTSTTTTTTTTTTSSPPPKAASSLLEQLSPGSIQSVLQALLAQMQQRAPTTTTTTTTTTPSIENPSAMAMLSAEQMDQFRTILGTLGLRSRGVPNALAQLVAADAGDEEAPVSLADSLPQFMHAAMPSRLLASMGLLANDTDSSPAAGGSATSPSSQPPPTHKVNLPKEPEAQDELVIRANIFAWENRAKREMGSYRAKFKWEEVGQFEKLNPAETVDDGEELDDQDLQNSQMAFYYKFDTYDARGDIIAAEYGDNTFGNGDDNDEEQQMDDNYEQSSEQEGEY